MILASQTVLIESKNTVQDGISGGWSITQGSISMFPNTMLLAPRACSCLEQWPVVAVVVATTNKAQRCHACGNGGLHASDAILDHHAGVGCVAHACRGQQEQVGCGFAMFDHRGAEDGDADSGSSSKRSSHPVCFNENRMRSGVLLEATQRLKGVQGHSHVLDRLQCTLECGKDMRLFALEKIIR